MMTRPMPFIFASSLFGLVGCAGESTSSDEVAFRPTRVFDLGALVTENLPEQVWGQAALRSAGFDRPNAFEILNWEAELSGGRVAGSNAYYTIFNHGGPHIDAPNHVSLGGGLDSYPIESFSGPVKLFDASQYPPGQTIPTSVFEGLVEPGDVVIVFTDYSPPVGSDELPLNTTLTPEAAEYLAGLPVRAYGTDAQSVGAASEPRVEVLDEVVRAIPIHHAFLSRGIPVYEQLFNVSEVLRAAPSSRMYFVGVPLNMRDGDGMIVRPVIFAY